MGYRVLEIEHEKHYSRALQRMGISRIHPPVIRLSFHSPDPPVPG